MSSESFDKIKNKATTLDFTIVSEDEPANVGTLGAYFKLTFTKGDKTIKREELICDKNYRKHHLKCSSCFHKPRECKCKKCVICNQRSCQCKKEKRKKPTPLATFVLITDVHIIDAASPARASFLAQYIPQFPTVSDSFRPYEAFTNQVADSMVSKINAIEKGPILGQKFGFVISTGDSGDTMQANEITNFINVLDGTKVTPNPIGRYVGVQDDYLAYNYESYYHPNEAPPGVSDDNYKVQYGYPNFNDILIDAANSFCATGLKVPYYSIAGNHDNTLLGNFSLGFYTMLTLFDQIATGKIPGLGSKLVESMTPVMAEMFAKALQMQDANQVLAILNNSQLREVPPSNKRAHYMRADFINAHFQTTESPGPVGHGYTSYNVENNVAYFTFKVADNITGIALDSCNLNGNLIDLDLAPNGGIGRVQLSWFERELQKRHSTYYNDQDQLVCTSNKDELILVFCHHTIDTMNNNFTSPTTFDNDPQRILGDEFVKVLHRYPNCIALINGHLHKNRITPYPDPKGRSSGFTEISTSSHIDFPQQSRIIEIGDNRDGTLSIFCTLIDHSGPIDAGRGEFPSQSGERKSRCGCCNTNSSVSNQNSSNSSDSCESRAKETYTIPEIASISRELSFNDPFILKKFDNGVERRGTVLDRNVEILIFNPLLRC